MTTYYYDIYGCVTDVADPQRSTDQAPPSCPNGEQPVWGGHENGWMCMVFTVPTLPSAPVNPYGTKITPLALSRRIGTTRLAALYTLAKTDVMVQIFIAQVWGAVEIDLEDPLLAQDMGYVVSQGTWTAADVTSIISPPAQQSEVPS